MLFGRKPLLALLIFGLLAVLAACKEETPATPSPPAGTDNGGGGNTGGGGTTPLPAMCNPYRVIATVVNGNTGTAISGARVYKSSGAYNGPWYWCTSGRDGSCGGDLGMVGEGVWMHFLASYGGVDSSTVAIPVHPPQCEDFVTLTVYP